MTALSIGVVAVEELTFGDLLAWVNHAVDSGVTADEPLYDYAGAPLRGLQVRVDVDAAEAASGYGVPWEREDDEPDPQPGANPSTARAQVDPIEQADADEDPQPEPEPSRSPSELAVCPDCGAHVKTRGMGTHRRKAHGVVASGAECPDCGQSMMPRNLTRHRGSPACRERQRAGTATDEPDADRGDDETEPAASPTPPASVPSAIDAALAAALLCTCGHARRRHEDGDGICEMPFCECTVYAEAGAA